MTGRLLAGKLQIKIVHFIVKNKQDVIPNQLRREKQTLWAKDYMPQILEYLPCLIFLVFSVCGWGCLFFSLVLFFLLFS